MCVLLDYEYLYFKIIITLNKLYLDTIFAHNTEIFSKRIFFSCIFFTCNHNSRVELSVVMILPNYFFIIIYKNNLNYNKL